MSKKAEADHLTGIIVDDADGQTVQVRIATSRGDVELLGSVRIQDRCLVVTDLHMQGPGPDRLGRAGLNAIARRIMDEIDVDRIIVHGALRTTGRNPGQRPRAVEFRR